MEFNHNMIKKMRGIHGWTQVELARRSGIDQRQLSRYEHKINKPTRKNIEKLARAFKVPKILFFVR